jgi:hypothetical protein
MAFNPLSLLYGWTHLKDRTHAYFLVATKGGDNTSSSSDQPGTAWAKGVYDVNSAAFGGEVALTVGTAVPTPGRSLKVVCTAAGNITVTYPDGSTGTWPVVVGTQTLPLAVTEVNSETATATFFNLK